MQTHGPLRRRKVTETKQDVGQEKSESPHGLGCFQAGTHIMYFHRQIKKKTEKRLHCIIYMTFEMSIKTQGGTLSARPPPSLGSIEDETFDLEI